MSRALLAEIRRALLIIAKAIEVELARNTVNAEVE